MEQNNSDLLSSFGNKLKQARKRAGISQEALAERADLDRTYISLLERGLRNPTLECIGKLARSLDTTVAELCSIDKEQS